MTNTIVVKSGAGTPSPDSLQEAELALDIVSGDLYSKLSDGRIALLNDSADGGGSGSGSSVHIGDTPPANPEEGQQWMEVPVSGDAVMWVYDGDKWLQQPGGKDGADGSNGADGKGFTGGSYDASTGIVTFTSDDGLGFVTDDLRGADGATYDDSWIQPALAGKANTGDSYTKAEADNAFEAKGTVVILTQAEYDVLTPDAGTVYFIK